MQDSGVGKSDDSLGLRRPKQERSVARFNLLLDAADHLLGTHEVQEVGLYQVASQAGVPAASAYHFFATPSALVLALAERYQREVVESVARAQAPEDGLWQTLLREQMSRLVALFNARPPMMKVMVGPHVSRELLDSDARFAANMAGMLVEISTRFFHMPVIRDPQRKFLTLLTIMHAIWGLSYSRHRSITPDFEAEASVAAIAYCRTFLPEFIERRAVV